jgi:hypothetical protein
MRGADGKISTGRGVGDYGKLRASWLVQLASKITGYVV